MYSADYTGENVMAVAGEADQQSDAVRTSSDKLFLRLQNEPFWRLWIVFD